MIRLIIFLSVLCACALLLAIGGFGRAATIIMMTVACVFVSLMATVGLINFLKKFTPIWMSPFGRPKDTEGTDVLKTGRREKSGH